MIRMRMAIAIRMNQHRIVFWNAWRAADFLASETLFWTTDAAKDALALFERTHNQKQLKLVQNVEKFNVFYFKAFEVHLLLELHHYKDEETLHEFASSTLSSAST